MILSTPGHLLIVTSERTTTSRTSLDFVELYQDRYDPMVRLAYLLTSDHAAAEELVQDAFVQVHGRWGHGIEHPKAYLRTAVVNTCRSWGRRKVREGDHHRRRLEAVPDAVLVADEMWDVLQPENPGRPRRRG